jgi:DNA end-binding protein Ku
MRTIWKGYLKCSLVTIPIKMCAVTTKRPLQFHLYHKACGNRINQENVCTVCGQTFPRAHFWAPALKRRIE